MRNDYIAATHAILEVVEQDKAIICNLEDDKKKKDGNGMINNDFMQYVYRRCEVSLTGDDQYKRLQGELVKALADKDLERFDELSLEMESRATELCFLDGFKEAIKLMTAGGN